MKKSRVFLSVVFCALAVILSGMLYLSIPTEAKATEATSFISTDGTPISTYTDWKKVSGSGSYYLANDIDCGNTLISPNNSVFSGIFNGNGYTIKNFRIDAIYGGLFYSNSGTIKNLKLENVSITSVNASSSVETGGLVGNNQSNGIIENCAVKNIYTFVMGNSTVTIGGLVGVNSGKINNCYVTGDRVYGESTKNAYYSNVGGIVGRNVGGTMTNSYATVSIYAKSVGPYSIAGGIIGHMEGGKVRNCFYAGAKVITEGRNMWLKYSSYRGGIVGRISSGQIENCYRNASTIYPKNGEGSENKLGTPVGSQKNYADFSSKDFHFSKSGFSHFVDREAFLKNETNAWLFIEGELPSLFYEGDCWADDADGGHKYEAIGEGGYCTVTCKICTHSYERDHSHKETIKELPDSDGITHTHYSCLCGNKYDTYIDKQGRSYISVGTLAELRAIESDMTKNYVLTKDIMLTGTNNWQPVGAAGVNSRKTFSGMFDGNGRTISGLNQTTYTIGHREQVEGGYNGHGYVGLFDNTGANAVIKNVTVGMTVNITALSSELDSNGNAYKKQIIEGGGIVGYNTGSIVNCETFGSMSADVGQPYLGGIVGRCGGGIVKDCSSSMDIYSNSQGGGLIGEMVNDHPFVKNCFATGTVKGSKYGGGLVGSATIGLVEDCYATGNVSVTGNGACGGGLIGALLENGTTARGCYATGDVEGIESGTIETKQIGGLIGEVSGSVNSCYSTGRVSNDANHFISSSRTGGLVGLLNDGVILYCYSTSNVVNTTSSKTQNNGGLIGSAFSTSFIEYSFATGNVQGGSNSIGGLIGYNDSEVTVRDCYRYSGQVITDRNSNVIASNECGTVTALSNFYDISFLHTIGFKAYREEANFLGIPSDTEKWLFVEGEFPYLYWQGESVSLSCDPKYGLVSGTDGYATAMAEGFSLSQLYMVGVTLTLSAQETTDSYAFDGWFIGNECISTSLEFSYTVTSGVQVIEARFSEKKLVYIDGDYVDYRGLKYKIEDDAASIIGYTEGFSYKGIVLNDYVRVGEEKYPLVSISEGAMSDYTDLVRVVLPKSILSIGKEAFSGCTELREVYFLGDRPSVGTDAFCGCSKTLTLQYDEKNDSWTGTSGWRNVDPKWNYDGWVNGTSQVSAPTLTYDFSVLNAIQFDAQGIYYSIEGYKAIVGDSSGCADNSGYKGNNDGRIVIPSYVLFIDENTGDKDRHYVGKIQNNAFWGNEMLKEITISTTVTTLGEGCFSACENLEYVLFLGGLPSTPTDSDIFSGASSSLQILHFVENSTWNAAESKMSFAGKNSYKVARLYEGDRDRQDIFYTFSSSSASVGTHMEDDNRDDLINTSAYAGSSFYSGVSGKALIPDYVYKDGTFFPVTEISRYAFYKSTHLEAIEIGRFVTDIYESSFRETPRLTTFSVSSENPRFAVESNSGVLLQAADELSDGNVIFTKVIKAPANITSFTAPDWLKTIGGYAFYMTELSHLDLGSGVDKIENSAFRGTPLSGNLVLTNVNTVDAYAFYNTKITSVSIGMALTELGTQAFGSCVSLTAFNSTEENGNFTVIDGVLFGKRMDGYVYLDGDEEKNFIPLTLIQYPASKADITEYKVPGDVWEIASYAFSGNRALQRIVFSDISRDEVLEGQGTAIRTDGLEKVGVYAFMDCVSLRSVSFGRYIIEIGNDGTKTTYESSVFSGCLSLSSIVVDSENERYYTDVNGILFDKEQKTLLVYPQGITRVTYTVPKTVETIRNSAFKGNTHLIRLVLPENVRTIEANAFDSCTSLKALYVQGGNAPMLESNAFLNAGTQKGIIGYEENDKKHIATFVYYRKNSIGWDGNWSILDREGRLEEYNIIAEVPNQNIDDSFYLFAVIGSDGMVIDAKLRVELYLIDGNEYLLYSTGIVAVPQNGGTPYAALRLPEKDAIDRGIRIKVQEVDAQGGTLAEEEKVYFDYVCDYYDLDLSMKISYITMFALPTVSGLTFDGQDINSHSAEFNIANYVETLYSTSGEIIGVVARDGENGELLSIRVELAGFCDVGYTLSYYSLVQNGIELARVFASDMKNPSIGVFNVSPTLFVPDIGIEVYIAVIEDATGEDMYFPRKPKILNVQVFSYELTTEDVDIDTSELTVDVAKGNPTLFSMLGIKNMDFSFGDKTPVKINIDGSSITVSMEIGKSKETGLLSPAELEKLYGENHGAYNYNTFFFQINHKGTVYNVRFARGTEKQGYYYYRCYNKTSGTKVFGRVKGKSRVECALKVQNIIGEAAKGKAIVDSIDEKSGTTQKFSVSLSGKLVFKYSLSEGIKLTSGEIVGTLQYTLKHNSQYVIWVIPVTLEVNVSITGKMLLAFGFDLGGAKPVSITEATLTVSAEVAADVGVGCSFASVGISGSVGFTLIIDFVPKVQVSEFKINGSIGVYAKILGKKFSKTIYSGQYYIVGPKKASEPTVLAFTAVNLNSPMFLASNYVFEKAEDNPGDYMVPTLAVIDDEIVQFYMADVVGYGSGGNGYDSWNFQKIVYSVLQYSDTEGFYWSEPTILDDNGYSDSQFQVYTEGDAVYVVYTQATIRLTEQTSDDHELFAGSMEVKIAYWQDGLHWDNIGGNWSEEDAKDIIRLSNDEYYQSAVSFAVVNGIPTVVWSENEDNNMFGVSPYNYIDINGLSHVYATTSNGIYYTQLADGHWHAPVCVESGLSAVTELIVLSSGIIVFVIDENGDLADANDRMMYFVQIVQGFSDEDYTGRTAVFSASGAYTGLKTFGTDLVYYLGTDDKGLYQVSLPTAQGTLAGVDFSDLDTSSIKGKYKFVFDTLGVPVALIYAEISTWKNSHDEEMRGSTLYGRFYDTRGWGAPIELFAAKSDRYIEDFGVVYSEGKLIFSILWVDEEEPYGWNPEIDDPESEGLSLIYTYTTNIETYLLSDSILYSKTVLAYTERNANFEFKNNGTNYIDFLYISVDGGAWTPYAVNIRSGMQGFVWLEDIQMEREEEHREHTLQFSLFADGRDAENVVFSLEHSNLILQGKAVEIGEQNHIITSIENKGYETNVTMFVFAATQAAAYLNTMDVDWLKENSESYHSFGIEQGVTKYFEIMIDSLIIPKENFDGVVTIYIRSVLNNINADSNAIYVLLGNKFQGENESGNAGVNYSATLSSQEISVDLDDIQKAELPLELEMELTMGTGVSLDSVFLLETELTAFFIFMHERSAYVLTLPHILLSTLEEGNYSIIFTFSYLIDGNTEHFSRMIAVNAYRNFEFTVSFYDDKGELLSVQNVPKGEQPIAPANFEKAPSEHFIYTFIGWDIDCDGIPDYAVGASLPETIEHMDFVAVYLEEYKIYTVTFILGSITSQERYSYGATAQYMGNTRQKGLYFVGWDMNDNGTVDYFYNADTLATVTGDTVYRAVYSEQEIINCVVTVISGTGSNEYIPGTEVKVTANLLTGYTFSAWKVGDTTVSEDAEYTFIVERDVTVRAVYTVNEYDILYYIDSELIYIDTFAFDSAVLVRPPAEMTGYTFSGWGSVPTIMPANNVTVSAYWSLSAPSIESSTGTWEIKKTYDGKGAVLPYTFTHPLSEEDGFSVEHGYVDKEGNTFTNAAESGTYILRVAATFGGETAITERSVVVNIGRASLLITADSYTIAYGGEIPEYTIFYDGFVENENESVLTTLPSVSSNYHNNTQVGTSCAVVVAGGSADNYVLVLQNGVVTVEKAVLMVKASSHTVTYGDAIPIFSISYEGFVLGETESVLSIVPVVSSFYAKTTFAGTLCEVSVSGGEASNYQFVYMSGTITIKKAELLVTASSHTVVYGSKAPAYTLSYAGFVNGEDESILSILPTAQSLYNELTPALQICPVFADGGEDTNYIFVYFTGTVTVRKAILTVTAPTLTVAYGSDAPAYTLRYTGFVNGEGISALSAVPVVNVLYEKTLPAGSSCSVSALGGKASNYEFSYIEGVIKIEKAKLTVIASSHTVSYGDEPPVYNLSFEGFANDEDESILTMLPSVFSSYSSTSLAGSTNLVIAEGGVAENYALVYCDGFVVVRKAILTVTGSSHTIIYGDTPPVYKMNYEGFVNGENASILSVCPEADSLYSSVTSAGTVCAVNVTGGEADNYEFVYRSGIVLVRKAVLVATGSSHTVIYGDDVPLYGISYKGFKNGEDENVISVLPSVVTNYLSTTSVESECLVVVAGGESSNYEFVYINGRITIKKKILTVIASSHTVTYGDTVPVYSVSYDGFINGDDESSLSSLPIVESAYNSRTAAGSECFVVASRGRAQNYDLVYTPGLIQIKQATPNYVRPINLVAFAGQVLSEITLSRFGNWTWDDPYAIVAEESNTALFVAVFTPDDNVNYAVIRTSLSIRVINESTPVSIEITTQPKRKAYAAFDAFEPTGMVVTMTDASGTTAEVPFSVLNYVYSNGGSSFMAAETFIIVKYGVLSARISNITVSKVDPPYMLPILEPITYSKIKTLAFVTLPNGWAWSEPDVLPQTGSQYYSVVFTHPDEMNYKVVVQEVSLFVKKAVPEFQIPSGLTASYGDTLSSVLLPSGFAWIDGSIPVGELGTKAFSAVYVPYDSDCYETIALSIQLTVEKAAQGAGNAVYITIEEITATEISIKPIKGAEYSFDGGETWQDSPRFTGLSPGQTYFIVARLPGTETHFEAKSDVLSVVPPNGSLIQSKGKIGLIIGGIIGGSILIGVTVMALVLKKKKTL